MINQINFETITGIVDQSVQLQVVAFERTFERIQTVLHALFVGHVHVQDEDFVRLSIGFQLFGTRTVRTKTAGKDGEPIVQQLLSKSMTKTGITAGDQDGFTFGMDLFDWQRTSMTNQTFPQLIGNGTRHIEDKRHPK